MKSLNAIEVTLKPGDCWQMQKEVYSILQQKINCLPKSKDVSEQQFRYPETPAALRAFLEKFFTRHFFQVQDSLLKEDIFAPLIEILKSSNSITILDIGAGPAVASLALLNILFRKNNK